MKKIIILFIFCNLFIPLNVFAKEPTDVFLQQIKINEDGSIKVQELIKLNGEYNGMRRDIYFKNVNNKEITNTINDLYGNSKLYDGTSITNIKIGSVENDKELTYSDFERNINYFTKVDYASNGENKKYTLRDNYNGVNLKLYNTDKEKEYFYIEYQITDAIVVHNDIAELAYNVLGDGYDENIGIFKSKIILPNIDSDYRVWLHGPLNGEVERNKDYALANFNFLGAYNPVSIRIIFNKNLVPLATKKTTINAKDEIIKYQTKLSNEANREREKIRQENLIIIITDIIFILLSLGLTLAASYLSKKSKKTNFNMEYFRDFPATYGPEVLEYLLTKNITEKSLSATILNLIAKKALKVEKIINSKKDDYKLIRIKEEKENLTETEYNALSLILNEIGNNEEVTLSAIKKYGSNYKNAKSFMDSYNNFLKTAKVNAKKENFFSKVPIVVLLLSILEVIGLVLVDINFSYDLPIFGLILIVLIIIFLTVTLSRKYYTKKGAVDYAKWMAHKKFLEDFSRFDEKELLEVTLWDKYLVYAIVLDCADKLSKEMKLKIETIQDTNTVITGYNPFLTNHLVITSIYNDINQSVHNAVSSSRSSIAESSNSSSDGFGGGSIGGGGSFGGGGGGGRF